MNREEIIKKYVDESYKKIDDLKIVFSRLNNSEKKILETGYTYAVQMGVQILTQALTEVKLEEPKQDEKKKDNSKMADAMSRAGKDVMKFLTG